MTVRVHGLVLGCERKWSWMIPGFQCEPLHGEEGSVSYCCGEVVWGERVGSPVLGRTSLRQRHVSPGEITARWISSPHGHLLAGGRFQELKDCRLREGCHS